MSGAYTTSFRGETVRLPGPLALAREGASGAGWYDSANVSIRAFCDRTGYDVARVCDVLALTSPRVTVRRNVSLALAYLATGSAPGIVPSVRAALAHYEATGVIRGLKTSAFARALAGDVDAVVIDVWMWRALGLDWPSVTPKRYRRAAATVRGIATRADMTPAATQAAIWVATRQRYGYVTHAPLVLPCDAG